jgi:hypothetical protein
VKQKWRLPLKRLVAPLVLSSLLLPLAPQLARAGEAVPSPTTTSTAPSSTAPAAAPTSSDFSAAPPPVAPVAPVTPPEPKSEGKTRGVWVHIQSATPAILYRRADSNASFARVCDSPCDSEMSLEGEYQLTAEGFKTTTLHLLGEPGQTLNIEVTSAKGSKSAGLLMVIVGGIGVAIGGILDVAGIILEGTAHNDSDRTGAHITLIFGLIITAVGVGIGAGGVITLAKSGDSGFTQKVQRPAAVPPAATPSEKTSDDRFLRTPMWRTASLFEQVATPTTSTIPIFSRSF